MLDIATRMCDSFEHEYNTATEQRNEERDLLSIIKQMAEKRMTRYRDASAPSGALHGVDKADHMEYEGASYSSTSGEWE